MGFDKTLRIKTCFIILLNQFNNCIGIYFCNYNLLVKLAKLNTTRNKEPLQCVSYEHQSSLLLLLGHMLCATSYMTVTPLSHGKNYLTLTSTITWWVPGSQPWGHMIVIQIISNTFINHIQLWKNYHLQ